MTDTHTPEERLELLRAATVYRRDEVFCFSRMDYYIAIHTAFVAGAEWQAKRENEDGIIDEEKLPIKGAK